MKYPVLLKVRLFNIKFKNIFNYRPRIYRIYYRVPQNKLPSIAEIRSDQSFNWSVWSMPHWVRFNPSLEYLKDYGVAEVKVTNKLYQEAANQFVLLHKPVENNFSHVELTGKGNLSRSDKLEMRSKIVNNAILKYDSGVQPRGLEKTSMYFLIVINIIVFIFTFWIYFNSKKQPIG